jgi:hypothetical protein
MTQDEGSRADILPLQPLPINRRTACPRRLGPAAARRAEGPHAEILPLQPRPINWRTAYLRRAGRVETAIAREWAIADARRCRLCPDRCHGSVSADGKTAMCLMIAREYVSFDDARLFSPARLVADGIADDAPRPPVAVDRLDPRAAGLRGGRSGA